MTNDLLKRLERHQAGAGARHTRLARTFRPVYIEGPLEAAKAAKRERQLKGWSRSKKTALIKGDLEKLRDLSRSKD